MTKNNQKISDDTKVKELYENIISNAAIKNKNEVDNFVKELKALDNLLSSMETVDLKSLFISYKYL